MNNDHYEGFRALGSMPYTRFLSCIIDQGLLGAMSAFSEGGHERAGATDALQACRGKSPTAIKDMYDGSKSRYTDLIEARDFGSVSAAQFMYELSFLSHVEWVLNCLSVFLDMPLLEHLPTTRAVVYATSVAESLQSQDTTVN